MLDSTNRTQFMSLGKKIGLVAGGVTILLVLSTMFRTVELGYTDVYQNTFTGNKEIYHGPDWYLSPLFIGKERTYKDETTITFNNTEHSTGKSVNIDFADTYGADLPLSARFRLPLDDEHMFLLDKSFRSYKNLVHSLYAKTTVDVSVGTATQFTAEEVFQGGLNTLKNGIEDQLNNGLFVTERQRVVVSGKTTDRVDLGANKTKAEQVEQEITVWKAVPKLDGDNKPLRMPNPLEQYNIAVSQVTLESPVPEPTLSKLLVAKKESVATKILSVQKQENAKEDIKTAKLEGQALREKAEQERLIQADAEIIERKKEVQLAGLQAEREIVDREKLASLAIIDKKKELQIDKDNEAIQKANAIAAKHQANAIEATGLAKAKVKKAMYLAVVPDILQLETEKAIAQYKYAALPKIKLDMPDNVMITGAGDGATPIADLANMQIVEKIGNLSVK